MENNKSFQGFINNLPDAEAQSKMIEKALAVTNLDEETKLSYKKQFTRLGPAVILFIDHLPPENHVIALQIAYLGYLEGRRTAHNEFERATKDLAELMRDANPTAH